MTRLLSIVAALEGAALLVYAVIDLIAVAREGLSGPTEVSNPAAFAMQVLIFGVLGGGMLILARGWWMVRRWTRGPFILAQLLGLVVGIPLLQSGGAGRLIGGAMVLVAAGAVILSLLPAVTRSLHGDQAAM